ncbi:MAG: hypothetical protein KBD01_04405 [Acidobacteria bacterium]|nr:hypothetical protein [Acidobacteriota bacterium]
MASDERPDRGRDLFDDGERSDPGAEDLHYEGPITIVDDEADEDRGPGNGRAFLTTAIVGGTVILIVGAALWLRSGTDISDNVDQFAARQPAEQHVVTDTPPSPRDEEPGDDARAALSVPYRAVPPGPPETAAPATQDAGRLAQAREEIPRPAPTAPSWGDGSESPREASDVRATPAPRPSPAAFTGGAGGGDVRALARDGRVAEAARAGRQAVTAQDWTLQVLVACEPDNVVKAFREVPGDDLTVLPARVDGRACYRLCWGTFPDRDSAAGAAAAVPAYFTRSGSPRPVQFANLR